VAENAVIVSWWSASTTLWYGQRVEGLRPDVLIVDDSNRVDNGVTFEQVTDVFDKYLGKSPSTRFGLMPAIRSRATAFRPYAPATS